MANVLHTMPLKCEALMSSGRCRTMELDEFGAYIILLCYAWLDEAKLPNNERALKKLVSPANDEQWSRIRKFVIDKMFEPSEDGKNLFNKHQVDIWCEVCEKVETLSDRGRKAAEARWKNSNTQGMHKQCTSNANQSQSQRESKKENIIKENPDIKKLIITETLKTLDIPEDIKKLFVDWVNVRIMCHGKLPAQSQDYQLELLLKIPKELRKESLKAAISGTWKNIGKLDSNNNSNKGGNNGKPAGTTHSNSTTAHAKVQQRPGL